MATVDDAIPPGGTPGSYHEDDFDPRRRDFFNVAAIAFGGAGAVVAVLPLINQMNPSADVLALSTTNVDLSKIGTGQAVTTSFRSQPLFVRNLLAKEIAEGQGSAAFGAA